MIKICGITNRDDALAAAEAGASAIGLNFYRDSPRYVSHTGASLITEKLPAGILKVGVFVDETAETVARIALRTGLDIAQLHGTAQCTTLPVWIAAHLSAAAPPAWIFEPGAEVFLLDTPSAALHGGTGRTFPWGLAREAAKLTTAKIIIAGGLDETNVGQAIEEAQPWGVDACSRLESSPGRKDHMKMRKFIEAARASGL